MTTQISTPEPQGFILEPCRICGAAMRIETAKSTNPVALGGITIASCSNEANHSEPTGLSDEDFINYPQIDDELAQILERFFYGQIFDRDPEEESMDAAKQAIHRYAQKMVLAELKELNQNATGDKCCSTHHTLVDRITTLEKELKHE